MAILFLELEDEITTAVGRLRAASERTVALVLPAGSRIASSRINFRLLAREAEGMGTQLAIVSPEATARALASAAGLPTFGTVDRYESAMAGGVEAAAGEVDGGAGPPASSAAGGSESGAASGAAASTAGAAGMGGPPALPVIHGRRRFALPSVPGSAVIAALGILVLFGAGTAAAAYFLLPEARITVTPRVEAFGPLVFEVTADPAAPTGDPAAGIVPATWLETTVEAQDTFAATGVKVDETKATGRVRFSNRDIDATQSIPAGSTVKTNSGVAFVTEAAVTVPRARVEQDPNGELILVPGTANVDVSAAKAGTAGNVAGGTITVVPSGYNANLLKVTNPNATSGGTHVETKVVRQSDYDAAVEALSGQLETSFGEWLDTTVSESQALVLPASAVLDGAEFATTAEDLVGNEVDSFDLAAQAAGRVLSVDPALLESAGGARFRSGEVPAGYVLIESSVRVRYTQVESDDPALPRFELTADGRGYRQLDAAALEQAVLGKPLDEARTILEPYGEPAITLAPDWFGTIPQLDWRVTVDVALPAEAS